jgi:predicted nucleotidyltransferase
MRLTNAQIETIRRDVRELAGKAARIWLFGSRLDDDQRGGDIDLMLELTEPVAHPARLAARLSARLYLHLDGHSVDVVVSAPNLQRLPIHDVAFSTGQRL